MIIRRTLQACLLAVSLFSGLIAQQASATVNVTIQPQTEVVFVGSNATFTAQTTITGGETITGYAWKFSTSTNGQPPFAPIAGATASVLSIPNAQTTNSGYYFVTVTYNSGTN